MKCWNDEMEGSFVDLFISEKMKLFRLKNE